MENLVDNTKKSKKLIFSNETLEYFDIEIDFKLGINPGANHLNNIRKSSNFLRDEMLNELDHLKKLILNNPDLKLKALDEEERAIFFNFVNHYSRCPICGATNHYSYLKRMYFNDENIELRDNLINFMHLEIKKLQNFNINLGIPCCTCFKKYLEKNK